METARGFLGNCYYNAKKNSRTIPKRTYNKLKRPGMSSTQEVVDDDQFTAIRMDLERTRPTPATIGEIKDKMAITRPKRQEFIRQSECDLTTLLKNWSRFIDVPSLVSVEIQFFPDSSKVLL